MANTDKTICGVPIEDVRKAYFKGKIPKLLTDIQAGGEYDVADFLKLQEYLQELKDQDVKLSESFAGFLPRVDEEEADPLLDELSKETLSEAEVASLDKDKDNRENARMWASKILKGLFVRYHDQNKSNPSEDELMDIAFELLGLQYHISQDEIYKERLFRRKITEYERQGKQRKTAEEYAKVTREYRDWRAIQKLEEQVQEFINLAKKRYKNI